MEDAYQVTLGREDLKRIMSALTIRHNEIREFMTILPDGQGKELVARELSGIESLRDVLENLVYR